MNILTNAWAFSQTYAIRFPTFNAKLHPQQSLANAIIATTNNPNIR